MALTAEQIIENRKKWAAALRSGEYTQIKDEYYDEPGQYCALGVGGHAIGVPDVEISDPVLERHFGISPAVLALVVDANDYAGKTFPEIADMVDALPAPEVKP